MATSSADIKQSYPLPVYNYKVEIDGEAVAFSEVSGLSVGYETTTYKESPTASGQIGPTIIHMPAQRTAVNVSLRKGLVRGSSIRVLYNWISTTRINQIQKKDIYVRLLDEAGDAVISWKVLNAFPTKLDAPSFDANSNDVAVESMELMADMVTIEEA
ncbi:MAG: phage tail protein [Nannocystaceae bacterium]